MDFLKKIKEKIDVRIIPALFSCYLFIKTFLPLLIISKYNHSNADDFWMSSHSHHAWEETHSLFYTIGVAFNNAVKIWQQWDGCFISMFIGCLPPVVFHEYYYRYTFAIIAGVFLIGAIFFLYELLIRVMKYDWIHFLIITPLVLILLVNTTPSAKDAFYWWVGGINYTFMFGVFLISQALLLEYLVNRKIFFLISGSLFAFATGMGNLLSGLVNPMVVVMELAFILYYRRNDKEDKSRYLFIIAVVCAIAGLLANVLSPGNLIRGGSDLFSESVLNTILKAIGSSSMLIPTYIKKGMGWIILGIAAAMFDGIKMDKIKFNFKWPLLLIVLAYGTYCATFAPVIYAHSAFYGRCKNISYFMMILLLLVVLFYVFGWVKTHISFEKFIPNYNRKIANYIGIVIVFITVFASALAIKNNILTFDCYSAKESLRIGQAQDFDIKVNTRFAKYYNNDEKEVYVEKIEWIPPIFYWDDDCLKDLEFYFQKDFIKVIE